MFLISVSLANIISLMAFVAISQRAHSAFEQFIILHEACVAIVIDSLKNEQSILKQNLLWH